MLSLTAKACAPNRPAASCCRWRHADALRLLFNLGADFSLVDKNNKTPRELVAENDGACKMVFTLIEDAAKALHARKLFYPVTIEELDKNDERYIKHHERHDELSKEVQCGPLSLKFFASYKQELLIITM